MNYISLQYSQRLAWFALAFILLPDQSLAWIPTTTTRVDNRRARVLCRISNLFRSGNNGVALPPLPKDVNEAVAKCRAATQEALKQRVSRMDIEFPVGTKFNIESVPKRVKKNSPSEKLSPTLDDLRRSDRELARLFVEMFQPVGGDRISVVFNDMETADLAKKKWKDDATANCRVSSMDRRRSPGRRKSSIQKKGFAAKLAEEMDEDSTSGGPFRLPENTEVALFVAPGPKELVVVEKICQQAGMGTLVILLNARISSFKNFGSEAAHNLFLKDFEPVFHLAAAPQDDAPNCLLYRAFPGNWVLARKPPVGQPKPILAGEHRPTSDECKAAVEKLALSPIEKSAEAALDTIAGWLS